MASLSFCSKLFRNFNCFYGQKSHNSNSSNNIEYKRSSNPSIFHQKSHSILSFHHSSQSNFCKKSTLRNSNSLLKNCKSRKNSTVICSANVQLQSTDSKNILDDLKSKVENAIGIPHFENNQPIVAKGNHNAFGMDGEFELVWASNGNHRINYYNDYMCSINGFDGTNNWFVDSSGNVQLFQLDDRDLHLLIFWIRTNFWLLEKSKTFLEIFIPSKENIPLRLQNFFVEFENIIAIKLIKCNVVAYMGLGNNFYPKKIAFSAYGNVEHLEIEEWGKISESATWQVPVKGVHKSFSGSSHSFQIQKLEPCETFFETFSEIFSFSDASEKEEQVRTTPPVPKNNFASFFSMPQTSKVFWKHFSGPKASFVSVGKNIIKMRRALSNHLMVVPLIDGLNIGWFVLDSGASGSTIVPSVADKLKMDSFGDLFITGVNGSHKTSFRRGESFQLGPLHISSPNFIEIDNLDHMIKGVGPVIGICGYEIFRNAVIELNLGSELTLQMFDPLTYELPKSKGVEWHKLYMMGNVPFVPAKLALNSNTEPASEVILILDIGAAGVDVIFHSRAVQSLGLASNPSSVSSQLLGLGGNGPRDTKHGSGVLASMEVAGQRVEKVKAVFSMSSGGVDLSEYVSGLLTCDFFSNFNVVLDYCNLRMALIPRE